MSEFGTRADSGSNNKLYSTEISLPYNGDRTVVRNTLNNMMTRFSIIRVSEDINWDNNHAKFTIFSEEDICINFYRDFRDELQTDVQKATSTDRLSLQSFQNEIDFLKQDPSSISAYIFLQYIMLLKNMKILLLTIMRLNKAWNSQIDKPTDQRTLNFETTIENKENADIFEEYIRNIVNDPVNFMEEVERQKSKKIHIFVDVSNITIGMQKLSDGILDRTLKLDVRNLTDLITDLRTVVSAVAVGSDKEIESIAIQKPYWQTWKQNGFKPIILQRNPCKGEQSVDEILVAQIATEAQKKYPEERTLVILTGDGNDNHGRGTSFPETIQNAMINGWTVILWNWSKSSNKIYERFLQTYPQKFILHHLDEFRDQLVLKTKTEPHPINRTDQQHHYPIDNSKNRTKVVGCAEIDFFTEDKKSADVKSEKLSASNFFAKHMDVFYSNILLSICPPHCKAAS
eukprot:gene7694-15749_t